MPAPEISVVVPVYNEEANLELLFTRLSQTLDALRRPWEIIFTNDGSKDRSLELLKGFRAKRPAQVRIIDFNGNYGQHMAIIAAFERVRGQTIVTIDADLQNPPEEIPKLLAKIDEGCDAVGGVRAKREDSFGRKYLSRLINIVREKTTDIRMTDQGCMLRAYRRPIVEAIVRSGERATFIPALAYKFASKNGEVEVAHAARAAGESKYSYYKLVRLNFDLITGFTLMPLQLFTLFAMACTAGSLLLAAILFYRRFVLHLDDETHGVFTLLAIVIFLLSVCMLGIGLIGEYVGRAYQCVQQRPRFVVREVFENAE